MPEDRGDRAALDAFSARIAAVDKAVGSASRQTAENGRRGSALGMAFRLSTELVAGLVVGGAFGWMLDHWLGTKPWLLILFFFCGMGAGLQNAVRTARAMNRDLDAPPDGPDGA